MARPIALFFFTVLSALALAQTPPLAITHVTVIDATGAAPQRDMTVVVGGERIRALGRTADVHLPENAQVVRSEGKFLIPGLWDMHVHWNDERYLKLFIANGVTGVRVMWGYPNHLEQRKRIAEGSLIGPRLALAGTIIDGPKPFWPESIAAGTAEEGREAVRRTQKEGYDYVKVYSSLPREVFFAIADEAKRLDIPFVGHVPDLVRVAEASDAGMKSVEHLTGMALAVSGTEAELRRELAAAAKLPAGERGERLRAIGARILESYDAATATALYAKLKANGTWQTPTFTVLRYGANPRAPEYANDPRLRYMPPWVRKMWSEDFRNRSRTPEVTASQERLFQRRLELVGEMHRAGVGILAGSDVLNPYCFPGFSLHEELGWLVKAGLPPMAALQAATRNPALFLGRAHEAGTVEPGKLADLVLLDADPLQDIGNTRRIAAVVANGKLYPREAIDRMLAEVERMARSN
jgi:imidazolonepropionase-like amidohydrolase